MISKRMAAAVRPITSSRLQPCTFREDNELCQKEAAAAAPKVRRRLRSPARSPPLPPPFPLLRFHFIMLSGGAECPIFLLPSRTCPQRQSILPRITYNSQLSLGQDESAPPLKMLIEMVIS